MSEIIQNMDNTFTWFLIRICNQVEKGKLTVSRKS